MDKRRDAVEQVGDGEVVADARDGDDDTVDVTSSVAVRGSVDVAGGVAVAGSSSVARSVA